MLEIITCLPVVVRWVDGDTAGDWDTTAAPLEQVLYLTSCFMMHILEDTIMGSVWCESQFRSVCLSVAAVEG